MPTYDYVCRACEHAFEHFQGMSDPLLRTCPECGKRKLERLIGSGAGIVFKGSGFYETDYKRKGSGGSEGSSSGGSDKGSGSGGSGSGSSTSKAADKPADKPTSGSGKGSDKGSGPSRGKGSGGSSGGSKG